MAAGEIIAGISSQAPTDNQIPLLPPLRPPYRRDIVSAKAPAAAAATAAATAADSSRQQTATEAKAAAAAAAGAAAAAAHHLHHHHITFDENKAQRTQPTGAGRSGKIVSRILSVSSGLAVSMWCAMVRGWFMSS